MKMNLKNIIFILGVLFLGSYCENFLDVHPKGEVTGKELLKDRKGFETPSTVFMPLCATRHFTAVI